MSIALQPTGQDAQDKPRWRAWARQQRALVDWPAVGAAVTEHLATWLSERPPTTVLTYLALADEPDLGDLTRHERHRFAITRTPDDGLLTVHPLRQPLERHRLGFLQPVVSAPTLDAADIGIVLVPGLAFDRHGGRLGRGRGHYDRLLGQVGGAVLVGVSAERLVVERLPREPHDVAVDLLVSERGIDAVMGSSRPDRPRGATTPWP